MYYEISEEAGSIIMFVLSGIFLPQNTLDVGNAVFSVSIQHGSIQSEMRDDGS